MRTLDFILVILLLVALLCGAFWARWVTLDTWAEPLTTVAALVTVLFCGATVSECWHSWRERDKERIGS